MIKIDSYFFHYNSNYIVWHLEILENPYFVYSLLNLVSYFQEYVFIHASNLEVNLESIEENQ